MLSFTSMKEYKLQIFGNKVLRKSLEKTDEISIETVQDMAWYRTSMIYTVTQYSYSSEM